MLPWLLAAPLLAGADGGAPPSASTGTPTSTVAPSTAATGTVTSEMAGPEPSAAPAPPDGGVAPPVRRGDTAANGIRLWWSFPRDDQSAIEVDEPDLHVSKLDRKGFTALAEKCDMRRAGKIVGTFDTGGARLPVREIRIEHLDPQLRTVKEKRCVLPLKVWRVRLGQPLVERLEDELDAHLSFLLPRRVPKPKPESQEPPR